MTHSDQNRCQTCYWRSCPANVSPFNMPTYSKYALQRVCGPQVLHEVHVQCRQNDRLWQHAYTPLHS